MDEGQLYHNLLVGTKHLNVVFAENFRSEYIQCSVIGQGGFGKVFAGHRAADFLPVSTITAHVYSHARLL